MTLEEAEIKLIDLDNKLNELLEEKNSLLKEWLIAFNTENTQNIICVDKMSGGSHDLYLINGESNMHICYFSDWDLKGNIDSFYKTINNSIQLINIANGRDDIPEYQKRLVYAKAIEIRESYQSKAEESLSQILSESEKDVANGNTAPIQGNFDDISETFDDRNTKNK